MHRRAFEKIRFLVVTTVALSTSSDLRLVAADEVDAARPAGVYLYDLISRTEQPIACGANRYYGPPHISGSHVIWTEGVDGPFELHLYDLSSGTTRELVPGRKVHQESIHGDHIVWFELSRMIPVLGSIFLYEISSARERRIANVSFGVGGLHVQGDWVVWSDKIREQCNIFAYRISKNQLQKIPVVECTDSSDSAPDYLALDDGRVVWVTYTWETKQSSSRSTFHIYDLEAGTERTIPLSLFTYSDLALQGNRIVYVARQSLLLMELQTGAQQLLAEPVSGTGFSIAGHRVTWESLILNTDGLRTDSVIDIYDLETGVTHELPRQDGEQQSPDIDGNHVVWLTVAR